MALNKPEFEQELKELTIIVRDGSQKERDESFAKLLVLLAPSINNVLKRWYANRSKYHDDRKQIINLGIWEACKKYREEACKGHLNGYFIVLMRTFLLREYCYQTGPKRKIPAGSCSINYHSEQSGEQDELADPALMVREEGFDKVENDDEFQAWKIKYRHKFKDHEWDYLTSGFSFHDRKNLPKTKKEYKKLDNLKQQIMRKIKKIIKFQELHKGLE